MSFVTTEAMLEAADKGGYAIGAFNVENMEMVMAVINACEEMHSPAILQTTPSTVKYAGLDMYLANVQAAAKRASVPIDVTLSLVGEEESEGRVEVVVLGVEEEEEEEEDDDDDDV